MSRNINACQFPFGQPLKLVEQIDRTPKRVFVLGVYASAVHARWIGANEKIVVKALAVASEPSIFWRGDDADEIIRQIKIPPELGTLVTADKQFNGPSGEALDQLILRPLGYRREDAWLCDLIPHSCMNPSQRKAIERYLSLVAKHNLPVPSIPCVPESLCDQARVDEIVAELRASNAETLVLLGDQPIKWFLKVFEQRWKKLSDFGTTPEEYGRRHRIKIDGREMDVIPLAHPRQVARLGTSSSAWHALHQKWLTTCR